MYARKWPLPLSPVQVSGITGILSEAPTITGELCSGARSPPLILSLPAEHLSNCSFISKINQEETQEILPFSWSYWCHHDLYSHQSARFSFIFFLTFPFASMSPLLEHEAWGMSQQD
jgi:hypothetical protein